MSHSLLSAYTIWYEWALQHVGGVLPLLFIVSCVVVSAGALVTRGFNRTTTSFLLLNIAAAVFVLANYLMVAQQALLMCCAVLLCVYAVTFGFGPLEERGSTKGYTGAALAIIAASTAVKFVELGSWPSLLNDYGARTGVETYSQFAHEPLRWVFTKANPYLFGGGTSVLHAPLVMLSFELFGHSIYAVRFAELLGSTLALSFLWLWLRSLGAGACGLAVLALFAFSSEHLSNSRVGTFYSVSQALSLCVLWLITRHHRDPQRYISSIGGLLLAALLLPSAYGPVRVLFVYIGILLVVMAARKGWHLRARYVLVALSIVVAGVAYLTLNQQTPFKLYTREADILATDSPIWFKTGDVSEFRWVQSPGVIVSNLYQNLRVCFEGAVAPSAHREVIFECGIAVLFCYAVLGMWTARWRLLSTYILCGFVPVLVTYPLLRRGIVIRPLVPALVTLLVREYVLLVHSIVQSRILKGAVYAVFVIFGCVFASQGLYSFTKYNSPVGIAPSFGPLHARNLYDHLNVLIKTERVVVLDPGPSIWQYWMEFADLFMGADQSDPPLTLMDIYPDTPLAEALPKARPLKVAVLNESRQSWGLPALQRQFSNLAIEEFREGDNLLFWIVTINQDGDGADGSAQ